MILNEWSNYQVVIQSYSLWVFAVGAVVVAGWCLIVLTVCMFVETPNSSLFPDVDFASRIVGPPRFSISDLSLSISQLFYSLSNAKSSQIIGKLRNKRFYVWRSSNTRQPNGGHVSLALVAEKDRHFHSV